MSWVPYGYMRATRIKPVSARHSAAQRERVARLKRTTHGPERCQWPDGCTYEAVDAHESLSRARGGDPTDPDWLLCRAHHHMVTIAAGPLLDYCKTHGLIRASSARADRQPARSPGFLNRAIEVRPALPSGGGPTAHADDSRLPVSDTTASVGHVSDTSNHSPKIALRLNPAGVKWLDDLAAEFGCTRTDVIRAALRVSSAHEREVRRALSTPRP